MNIYYVYFYLREDFTPYYVGKGKNKRAWTKREGIKIPKDKSKIILVKTELTEIQSFILERYYIRWFGRKDNGTGILRNMTDGAEGVSGSHVNKGRKFSEEHKKKLSEKRFGRKLSEQHKEKLHSGRRGTKNSKEHIEKMINGRLKKGVSESTRKKMSENRKKLINKLEIASKGGKASSIAYKSDPERQKRHSERMKIWWKDRKQKKGTI